MIGEKTNCKYCIYHVSWVRLHGLVTSVVHISKGGATIGAGEDSHAPPFFSNFSVLGFS